MPTAPTLVTAYVSSINPVGGNASVTSPTLNVQGGDVITVIGIGPGGTIADAFVTPTTTIPIVGGSTQLQSHSADNDCQGAAWSYLVSGALGSAQSGTVTVGVSTTSNNSFHFVVIIERGGQQPTVARSALQAGSSRTMSYTPSQANSSIVWAVGDWAAGTIQVVTPTSTSHTTSAPGPTALPQSAILAGQYTENTAIIDDAGAVAAVSYGISGTGTGPFTIIVVETAGPPIPPDEGSYNSDATDQMWAYTGMGYNDGSLL